MIKAKRILSLTLCAIVLISSFLCLSSCANTALTVSNEDGSFKVSYDLLRYFAMNYINGYEGVSAEDFASNEELQKKLSDNVFASVCDLATYKILAEKYGVSLSRQEKKEVKNTLKEYKKSYESKDAFKKDLEANYITEKVLEEIYMLQALFDKLYTHMTNEYTGIFRYDNDVIDADIEAGNFFSAEYIVIYYTDDNKEERLSELSKMLDEAKGGKSMSVMRDEKYSEYAEQIVYNKEDIFTYTEMNETYENAVTSIEIGAFSDIIDMENAAMIVHRLPLSEEYIDKNYNDVIAKYLSREFFKYIEEYSENLVPEFKDKYKDLKLWEME